MTKHVANRQVEMTSVLPANYMGKMEKTRVMSQREATGKHPILNVFMSYPDHYVGVEKPFIFPNLDAPALACPLLACKFSNEIQHTSISWERRRKNRKLIS